MVLSRGLNKIYSVKINYRIQKSAIIPIPFDLAAVIVAFKFLRSNLSFVNFSIQGCLQANSLDRYVAHYSADFAYSTYDANQVSTDYFQELSFEGYVEDDEFNRPLPGS